MSKLYKFTLLALMLVTSITFAQTYKVSGEVTSTQTGEKLIGANVYVKGLAIGAATDANGVYEFNLPSGSYTIICSYIGFEAAQVLNINVTNNMDLNFELKDYEFSLNVTVLADRAKERETPVAFTNIDKKDIELEQVMEGNLSLLIPKTPIMLFNAKEKLRSIDINEFCIDLSYIKPDEKFLKELMSFYAAGKNFEISTKFNFKRGVK